MASYLLSLTLLTAALLLLRTCFCRHVPARLIYAMWLIVLIRMLIPVSLFSVAVPSQTVHTTEVSPPPITVQTETVTDAASDAVITNLPQTVPPVPAVPDADMPSAAPDGELPQSETSDLPASPAPAVTAPQTTPAEDTHADVVLSEIDIPSLLYTLWFCGTVLTGLWFLLSACHFDRQLRRSRTYLRTIGRTRVYRTDDPFAPCLAGIPPTIYLSDDAADRPLSSLVLIHEYTHLRHGDPLWSFCRAAAVCVFWWHPLIRAAAVLSAQDAELACDEAVAAKLDDDLRIRYANIILDTVPQKRRTVTGLGSHPIRERILRLSRTTRCRVLPMLLAVCTVLTLLGCSFGTLTRTPARPSEPSPHTESVDTARTDPDVTEPLDTAVSATGTSSLAWLDRTAIQNGGYAFGGLVMSTRQNDTRCRSFPLGTRYRLYLFYDLDRSDSKYPYSHRYVRLLAVDMQTGQALCCETLDTDNTPSQISYLSENSCILYNVNSADQIGNAFLVTVGDSEAVVTAYPEQNPDSFVRYAAYLVSPDGRYTVVSDEDPLSCDGGITVYTEDGTAKRIFENVLYEEAAARGLSGDAALSAVVGYRPVGFLDDTRLVYNMTAYEGCAGWGIYDLATGENTAYGESDAAVLGLHDGCIYVQYGRGYGNVFDRIDRIAADGTVTTLATAKNRREEDTYVWNNGTWIQSIYRETPDTPVHTMLPDDMTVVYDIAVDTLTLRVLSADMTEVLLEFDVSADLSRFFWQERILITEDRVTVILEIEQYPEILPEDTVISAVVTDTAAGTVYVCDSPNTPDGVSVYSRNPDDPGGYRHYVPRFADGITHDALYLYPYVLPGDSHDSFRMLCESEQADIVRYYVLYADWALSEVGQMLCEREISHDEYIRLRTEAYNRAPYPALVDDTVPLTALKSHMEGLDGSGVFDAVLPDYCLTVSGLSVPLRLYMHGDSVYAAEAYGHRTVFTEPLDIYGNCDFDIFETDGTIVVKGGYDGIGDVYTFSKDGADAVHDSGKA